MWRPYLETKQFRNYPWEPDMAPFNAGCDFSRKSRGNVLEPIQEMVSVWLICIPFQKFIYNQFSRTLDGRGGELVYPTHLQRPMYLPQCWESSIAWFRLHTCVQSSNLGCHHGEVRELHSSHDHLLERRAVRKGGTSLISPSFLSRAGIQNGPRGEDAIGWVASPPGSMLVHSVCVSSWILTNTLWGWRDYEHFSDMDMELWWNNMYMSPHLVSDEWQSWRLGPWWLVLPLDHLPS